MIDKCITPDTKYMQIDVDSVLEFDKNKSDEYEEISKMISQETGVPQGCIYSAPYLFLINRWFKINGEWYFFKSDNYDFHFINELLGEYISRYFELDTITYQVGKLCVSGEEPKYGVVSKNFCDVNLEYKKWWDYHLIRNEDMSFLEDMKKICETKKEYKKLAEDIKKLFIRDFATCQHDRVANNFLFKVTKDGIRLAPLYDYELSFNDSNKEVYKNQFGTLNMNDRDTRNLLLKDKTFQKLLNKLMMMDIDRIMEEVEDVHKILIPKEHKEHYEEDIKEVKDIIRKQRVLK